MDKETKSTLKKIQSRLNKGDSVTAAASSVGWRRQRAHAHVARGNLSLGGDVTSKMDVKAPEIYHKFGKVIAHKIRGGKYGSTLQEVSTHMTSLIASIDDSKAYNVVITRLAAWMLENCKPSPLDAMFIRYCSLKNITLLRKVCVARYNRGQF